jgi:hypothetical protein
MPICEEGHDSAKTPMTDAHKAALAEGREQGRAVRAYLDAVEANVPRVASAPRIHRQAARGDRQRDGWRRSAEAGRSHPGALDLQAGWPWPTTRSTSRRPRPRRRREPYSDRKGITRRLARVGVSPAVLKAAGLRSACSADRPSAPHRPPPARRSGWGRSAPSGGPGPYGPHGSLTGSVAPSGRSRHNVHYANGQRPLDRAADEGGDMEQAQQVEELFQAEPSAPASTRRSTCASTCRCSTSAQRIDLDFAVAPEPAVPRPGGRHRPPRRPDPEGRGRRRRAGAAPGAA